MFMFLFYLQINKIIEIEIFSCDFRCHQRRGQKVTEEIWMWNLHKKLNGAGSGARWGAARRGRCLCQPVPAGSEEICPPVVRQLQAASMMQSSDNYNHVLSVSTSHYQELFRF